MSNLTHPQWIEITAHAASAYVAHASGLKTLPDTITQDEFGCMHAEDHEKNEKIKEFRDLLEKHEITEEVFDHRCRQATQECETAQAQLGAVVLWSHAERAGDGAYSLNINLSNDKTTLTVMADADLAANDGLDVSVCVGTFPALDISAAAQCAAKAMPRLLAYDFEEMRRHERVAKKGF